MGVFRKRGEDGAFAEGVQAGEIGGVEGRVRWRMQGVHKVLYNHSKALRTPSLQFPCRTEVMVYTRISQTLNMG